MQQKQSCSQRVLNLISSEKFFWAIIVLLVIEAGWIAASSAYPMAFDEDFHLGIIRLYASHISPFWAHQPPGANAYGAVARDPSYLYQYLMSFPYRLVTLFTSSQMAVVLFLRAINIALFSWGLVLFSKVLRKTGAAKCAINLSLLVFILLPVVPLLAAQINYDNLLLPTTALSLLATINMELKLRRKQFEAKDLVLLISLLALGSLVKYAFLPIALSELVYLAIRLRQTLVTPKAAWTKLKISWQKLGRKLKICLSILLLVSITLFSQRYVVNTIEYHNPIPGCGQVLTFKQCSAYGPWIRDYNYSINKTVTISPTKGLVAFTGDWFYGMWVRVFFALGGPGVTYQTRGPFILPGISAVVIGTIGLLATLWSYKRLLKRYDKNVLILLFTVGVVYILSLFIDEFKSYIQTSQPVAINGRYLFPVLVPLILLGVLGVNEVLKDSFKLKLAAVVVSIVCLAWGGGALTYILRSNDRWYWQSSFIDDVNKDMQHVLGPITPGYRKPTQFLH